jgi:hypothetical protein
MEEKPDGFCLLLTVMGIEHRDSGMLGNHSYHLSQVPNPFTYIVFETGPCSLCQAGLELEIHLTQAPK